jgi:hypothetical protein
MSNENESEGIVASLIKTIENNWRLLLVGIIIIAIAITSSSSDEKSSEGNKNSPTPTPQTEQSKAPEQNKPAEQAQKTETKSETVAATPAPTKEPAAVKSASSDANTNVQIAARSEGITHLARRAVKEYLGSANENLSAEQKIYAEDYLKKKIGSKKLAVGEEVKFSTELIKQGIEKAKGLSENQIKNLSKYVPLVKNLN